MGSQKIAAARLSVFSNTFLVLLKLVVGVVTGSVSVLSEAVHSAVDLLAAGIAFFSVRASDIPADDHHPYGHGKIENVSGVAEGLLIFGAAGLILYQAVQKFREPEAIEYHSLAIAIMAISVFVNWSVSRFLMRVARETESIALEADAHHLGVDVLTSLGVALGLVVTALTGWTILDPLIAVGVALFIMRIAWNLASEAGAPLLDHRLPQEEIQRIRDILDGDARVLGYHKVRARRSGAHRHVDLHLQLDPALNLLDAHRVAEEVEDQIRDAFPAVHVITHVEPATEEETAVDGSDPGIHKSPPRPDRGSV
jgi:cation diffusion facilitator family transporter